MGSFFFVLKEKIKTLLFVSQSYYNNNTKSY